MSRVRNTLICAAAVGLLLAPAGPALASYRDVIRDCAEDGQLDRRYDQAELDQAEDRLPSDLDEYSDCREVIAAASGAGSGRGSAGGGAGGGGTGGTLGPGESTARQRDEQALGSRVQQRDRKPRVEVGGTSVEPGKDGLYDAASGSNGMPLSLLLALIAIGLLGAGGAAYALRRRIPALSNLSLPRPSLLSRVSLPRLRR